ncbi:hypothetical protein NLJ89_g10994 [Agrocybe chaxingu]|uniref:Uncharacterized protein n=1 Tax=Agrocybe chaxingu TaxID=84603 RepID=A0A9W8JQ33_9AGAR|nr:hypothetical protein NLJ89_g10994 [Agrocybe chaxingu]
MSTRSTRQSTRLSSLSVTPRSNATSDVFSSRPQSVVTTETPITSDVEGEDAAQVSVSARATRATARAKAAPKTNVKRRAESEPEVEDDDDDELALRAPSAKRRAVSSTVVVEIPVRATKGRAKAKV